MVVEEIKEEGRGSGGNKRREHTSNDGREFQAAAYFSKSFPNRKDWDSHSPYVQPLETRK